MLPPLGSEGLRAEIVLPEPISHDPLKKKKKSISSSDPNTVILKVEFESLYVFLVKITNYLDQGCLQSLLNKHQKEKETQEY